MRMKLHRQGRSNLNTYQWLIRKIFSEGAKEIFRRNFLFQTIKFFRIWTFFGIILDIRNFFERIFAPGIFFFFFFFFFFFIIIFGKPIRNVFM